MLLHKPELFTFDICRAHVRARHKHRRRVCMSVCPFTGGCWGPCHRRSLGWV